MKLALRVGNLKPSPTLAISAKAKAMKAEGRDVVDFGAGEPDFDTPDNIKDAAINAIKGGFTKYTAVGGIPELKDAIIDKFKNDNTLEYTREEIIISCGGKHVLYNLCQALFQQGDEVIVPAPYWVSYPAMITLAGAEPVILNTGEETGFRIDTERLKESLTPKTRAIVLNSPSNPTGTVYSREELMAIYDTIKDTDILVISDEIYEKLLYEEEFVSFANLGEDAKKRTIIVNGLSKSYAMTGWRLGYAAGDSDIIRAMTSIQSQSTSNPTSISQKAGVEALRGRQDDVLKMVQEFDKRRRYIIERLNTIKGVSCIAPMGAFYVFPNISKLFGLSYKGTKVLSSTEFSSLLLKGALVTVVPGAAFGAEGYIRISYAKSLKEIEKGLDRMEGLVSNMD